jgi:hypothetical protein
MMSEEQIREWRDQEVSRCNDIANPTQKKKEQRILYILNAVLEEDVY